MTKMYLVQDDALSGVLATTGYYDGFRPLDRADVEAAMTRMYGKPVALRPGRDALKTGGRYFAEDN